MFEFVIPSRAKVPVPHYHKDVDEAIYALDGVYHDHNLWEKARDKCRSIYSTPSCASSCQLYRAISKNTCNPDFSYNRTGVFQRNERINQARNPPDAKRAVEIMMRYGLVPNAH